MEFLFYDTETSSTDPRTGVILQIAWQRTNENFDPIENPQILYCKLPLDKLIHPQALLVHKLTPQFLEEHGDTEAVFAQKVHEEFKRENTCIVGYNNLSFDDEFIRNLFYRNFLPIYERETKNGNSRWDLLPVVRLLKRLHPELLKWPTYTDGKPSFKLEELAKKNHIQHENAHDALSDVQALISLTELIKNKKQAVLGYLMKWLDWKAARDKMLSYKPNTETYRPIMLSSRAIGYENNYTSLVLPYVNEPYNKVIAFDLSQDIHAFLEGIKSLKNNDDINDFRKKWLADHEKQWPLITIALNKCATFWPLEWISQKQYKKVGINAQLVKSRLAAIANAEQATEEFPHWLHVDKLCCLANPQFPEEVEIERRIYDGFFSTHDKTLRQLVASANVDKLPKTVTKFQDERLPFLYFLYRARNAYETLSPSEKNKFHDHIRNTLMEEKPYRQSLPNHLVLIEEKLADPQLSKKDKKLLQDLLTHDKGKKRAVMLEKPSVAQIIHITTNQPVTQVYKVSNKKGSRKRKRFTLS